MNVAEVGIKVLKEFGGSTNSTEGLFIKFLLPSFFWIVLFFLAKGQWKHTYQKKDFLVMMASLFGFLREIIMFFVSVASFSGFVTYKLLQPVFPPIERALNHLTVFYVIYAFIKYYQKREYQLQRIYLFIGLGFGVIAYFVCAIQWPKFIKVHPGAGFEFFWGEILFRSGSAMIFLAGFLWFLIYTARARRKAPFVLPALVGVTMFFLNEFIMIFNLASEAHSELYIPLRGNLHIWAIAFLIMGYWRETRQRLFERERELKGFFNLSPMGLVVFERDGSIRIKNPALNSIFAIRDDIDNIRTLGIEPEDIPSTTMVRIERTITVNKTRRWILWRIVYDPEIDLYYAAVADITDQKLAEQERLEKQKLETLRISLYSVAHDFNNLLTGIIGNIQLLQLSSDSEKTNKYIQRLSKAAWLAKDLVEQLLLFANPNRPLRKNLVYVAPLIEEVAKFYTEDSNVELRIELPKDLWPVRVDETQFRQMVLNLVVNALDAMPAGGTLTVAAENYKDESGHWLKLIFKDTGKGIEPDQINSIFQPFYTTKAKGTGLGLAIVKTVLDRHNGRIEVESEPGKGTTFKVYLPAEP